MRRKKIIVGAKRVCACIQSLALLFMSFSVQAEVIRLSEPVESTADTETFGAPLDQALKSVALSELVAAPEKYVEQAFLVETRVAKVCQKKGCFFIAQDGADYLRVSFKDYGFFVPTDIGGRKVTLTGTLVEQEISKKQAKHLNADLASPEPKIKPGAVYEIVATSVRVPKAKS